MSTGGQGRVRTGVGGDGVTDAVESLLRNSGRGVVPPTNDL